MQYKPSRKITNTRNKKKIGFFPSKKNERNVKFESPVERDFMHLLEFDTGVLSYFEQPITIHYSYNGKKRRYTPDFKVIRRDKIQLIEIKPLDKYKKILEDKDKRSKYDAAINYCNNNNFEFKVITDVDIRSGYLLKNIKYLFMYSSICVPDDEKDIILNTLNSNESISIFELLTIIAKDDYFKTLYTRYIYNLMYYQSIFADLNHPISFKNNIWI